MKKAKSLKSGREFRNIRARQKQKQSTPSGYHAEIIILPPESPTDEMIEIIESTPGLYYKPRGKRETRFIGDPHKWEALGCECYLQYLGILQVNGISNLTGDDTPLIIEELLNNNKE